MLVNRVSVSCVGVVQQAAAAADVPARDLIDESANGGGHVRLVCGGPWGLEPRARGATASVSRRWSLDSSGDALLSVDRPRRRFADDDYVDHKQDDQSQARIPEGHGSLLDDWIWREPTPARNVQ